MRKIIMMFFICNIFYGITGQEILRKIDELSSLEADGTAKVKLTIQEVGQSIKIQEMLYYRQDKTDSFLIVILTPPNEKGNGYLKNKENMWFYKKNTRTFQFISSDENIGSSKATADDFEEKKLSEEYSVAKTKDGKEMMEEVKLGNRMVYKVELIGVNKNVKDPKRIYWVDKETFLPLKIQNYSLSGNLMETIEIGSYKKIGKSYMATKFIVVDEFEKGNKTLVEITDISTKEISSSVFTKAYLENLSK